MITDDQQILENIRKSKFPRWRDRVVELHEANLTEKYSPMVKSALKSSSSLSMDGKSKTSFQLKLQNEREMTKVIQQLETDVLERLVNDRNLQSLILDALAEESEELAPYLKKRKF